MDLYAVRNETESGILKSLAVNGGQSRADLARRMDVMRSTIGTQANRLIENGLVRAAGGPAINGHRNPKGRPGSVIELDPNYCKLIGVDFSIGRIRAVVTDFQGNVVNSGKLDVQPETQTPEQMATYIINLVKTIAPDDGSVAGITVSVPGIVNKHGQVIRIPHLNWRDVALQALIQEELKDFGPIALENDANVFARGEVSISPDRFEGTRIFFWMDSGVGAGITFDGHLLSGQTGRAGEIGHIFVPGANQRRSVRLDDVVGKTAFFRRYSKLGGTTNRIRDFIRDYRSGKHAADQLIEEWVGSIGEVLSSMTSLFDPGGFVFGGPMSELLAPAKDRLETALSSHLLHGTIQPDIYIREPDAECIAKNCVFIMRDRMFSGKSSPG